MSPWGKGAVLHVSAFSPVRMGLTPRFDRDTILLPEILLQDFEGDSHALAKTMVDALWQAAGLPRCFNYNDAGVWEPRN
jgi:hypothetical protein